MRINRTTKRTIDMLDILSKHKKGLTLKEIMRIMDIPQTSAFDILQTLLAMNVVEENYDEFKRYTIGVKAYELGMAYSYHQDVIQAAIPYLEELAEKLGKTTFLGILDKNQVTYIYKYEPFNTIITTAKIGSQNDVYCTSLGKAILAYMDEGHRQRILQDIQFIPKTKYTIIDKEDFERELYLIKQRGYAIDDRELEEHIFCMGAPVFDYKNDVIAAVSATGLYKKDMDVAYETSLIQETAIKISQRLGNTFVDRSVSQKLSLQTV